MAQAEIRHAELLARRDRRRQELERQRSLQAGEWITSVLVLPNPDQEAQRVRSLRPDPETEVIAMRVVIEHERSLGRLVFDVSDKDLGYDVTSLDLTSGDLLKAPELELLTSGLSYFQLSLPPLRILSVNVFGRLGYWD